LRFLYAAAEQAAEKAVSFVIPSEARKLSSAEVLEKKERFLAALGMTKSWRDFFATCEEATHKDLSGDRFVWFEM
jgi:hypothetical protein